MTLKQLKEDWIDVEQFHKAINDYFVECVNEDDKLKEHRDFVEKGWGFGERSFWWLWKLLCYELPHDAKMLEIGVYKGATLSVWRLLKHNAKIYGITPLSSEDGYPESDYGKDIEDLHNHFNQPQPDIFVSLSTKNEALVWASINKFYDLIYIDGGHSKDVVMNDLLWYSRFVKTDGYLVMDDANSDMHMPHGYFQGHSSVTEAKNEWLKIQTDFEFICSVVHISVFKRIK